jgi:hypothetical protein
MPEVAGALFYERLFTLNPDFQPPSCARRAALVRTTFAWLAVIPEVAGPLF